MGITLMRWLFEKTAIGSAINNHKTSIGVTLIVLWAVLQGLTFGLEQAILSFPNLPWLTSIQVTVASVLGLLAQVAEFLGIALTSVGTVHKVDKLNRAVDSK